jgi:hypothetical protein
VAKYSFLARFRGRRRARGSTSVPDRRLRFAGDKRAGLGDRGGDAGARRGGHRCVLGGVPPAGAPRRREPGAPPAARGFLFSHPQRCRRSFEPALARRRSVSPSPHSRPSRRRHLRHRACFRRRPIHLRCRPCFRHRGIHRYWWNSHPLRPARSCLLRAVCITQGRPKLPPSHFRHPAHAVGTMPRQRTQT